MKSSEIKDNGFILRIIPGQEADLIVRILTSQGEKISGFAKAGLKSQKRFGGALEPLTHISFRASKRSHSDLYYLEEIQTRNEFKGLRADFERLTAATYCSELADLGSQEGLENRELYNLLGAAWKALEQNVSLVRVTRQFEIKILSLLGWLPDFKLCSECGKSGVDLSFQSGTGRLFCRDCGETSVLVSKSLQGIIRKLLATSILQNEIDEPDSEGVAQVQKITTPLFYEHLGEQKIKTYKFLGSLRRFQE